MSPRAELLEIVGQLKNLLISYPQIGLEIPKPSRQSAIDPNPGDTAPTPLESLASFIGDCKRCKLSQKRTRLVFGRDPPRRAWFLSARGQEQKKMQAGRPFVGEAGEASDKNHRGRHGPQEEDVYIVMWSNAGRPTTGTLNQRRFRPACRF